jgi:tRNA threonylcarbamoyladenosine modification (KEOPS) complex  Pcc1 subunit
MISAEVSLQLSPEVAAIVEESLIPEAEHPISQRSNVEIKAEKERLMISMEASDVTALRAAFNSYLRWVEAIVNVVDSVS